MRRRSHYAIKLTANACIALSSCVQTLEGREVLTKGLVESEVQILSPRRSFPHREIQLHLTATAMKIYGLIFSGALLIAVLMLYGQEAAPPSVDLFPAEVEPSPTPPPNGPELPALKQLDDSFKPRSLGTAADELQVHALWRQLKNRTVNDPEVQEAKKYAQAARTDLERRNRFRNYYEIYYQRMSALATTPQLKVALQALKESHQGMLAQPRVRPSPTPEFTGTPSPTPTSTPFKKQTKEKKKKKVRT